MSDAFFGVHREFIPGPNESEEAFWKRVEYCKNALETLKKNSSSLEKVAPQKLSEYSSSILTSLQQNYDLSISWVPLFFSNYRLPFWSGGCAWIVQLKENSPLTAFLQLRAQFKQKASFLYFYSFEEVLSHELVHVARMSFEEPIFEEILAYKHSKSGLRSYLGPLLQSGKEAFSLVLLLALLLCSNLYAIIYEDRSAFTMSLYLQLTLLSGFIYLCCRLIFRQKQLSLCIENVQQALFKKKREKAAEAVAVRLTDKEIVSFSFMNEEAIIDYAEIAATKELRWQFIHQNYF